MIAVAPPPAKPPTCVDALAKEAINCQLDAQTSGNSAKAAQGFEDSARALRANDPEAGKLWAAAGNMWIEADQPGKAAFAFDQALAAPGMTGDLRGETLLDRARAAEAQGDLKMARAKLTEAAATGPRRSLCLVFFGCSCDPRRRPGDGQERDRQGACPGAGRPDDIVRGGARCRPWRRRRSGAPLLGTGRSARSEWRHRQGGGQGHRNAWRDPDGEKRDCAS